MPYPSPLFYLYDEASPSPLPQSDSDPRHFNKKMEDFCRRSGKSSWPELVGVNGEVAAGIIMRENRKVRAIVVKEGNVVTMDYRCDRVWVWVDKHGLVKHAPRVG